MNRLAIMGIGAEAAAGKAVVVVTRRCEMDESLAQLTGTPSVVRVTRANGRERVDYASGGSVRFVTSIRGHSADVVYLDRIISEHVVDDAWVAVQSSPVGEVVRA